jgi:hypothetical protein
MQIASPIGNQDERGEISTATISLKVSRFFALRIFRAGGLARTLRTRSLKGGEDLCRSLPFSTSSNRG